MDFSKELSRPGFENIQKDNGLSDRKVSPQTNKKLKRQSLPSIARINSKENMQQTITTNYNNNSDSAQSLLALKNKINNHALKFSQYIWRKDFAPQYNNSSCDQRNTILISINKTIKGQVDFNKQLSNGHDMFSHHILNGPTIGMYNPKYESIHRKSPEVLFGKQKNKIKLNKKFLLKKIWSNYKVTREYQLVNLKPVSQHNNINDYYCE